MNRKVTVSFTEPENEAEQKGRIAAILADGVYSYLKKRGHLREDASLTKKAEKIIDQSRKMCQRFDEIDSA